MFRKIDAPVETRFQGISICRPGPVKTLFVIVISAKGLTMMQFLLKTGLVLVLAMAGVSCDKIKPPLPELQQPPTASDQAEQRDRERSEFGQTAQKELDELRAAIAELRAKTGAANAQTRARLGEQADKLELEWREAQKHLLELKSATVESWRQMKDSFGKTMNKLKASIEASRREGA